MQQVEKAAIHLTNMGNKKEADEMRHQVAHTLINAKKPKPNLTITQRKGLAFLKESENLSVTPFDKGQGFCTIETEKLVEKVESDFCNITLDTRNNTNSYETKIQTKLRELLRDGKIDKKKQKSNSTHLAQ